MGLRNIIKSLFARNDMKDEKETNSSQDLISVIPSDEPHLHFISENRRKEQSAETDKFYITLLVRNMRKLFKI